MRRIWIVDAVVTKNIKRSPLINARAALPVWLPRPHIFSDCFSKFGLHEQANRFHRRFRKISRKSHLKMTRRRLHVKGLYSCNEITLTPQSLSQV